jgi:hypothetical protein
MTVADCWKAYIFKYKLSKFSIVEFSDMLAYNLLNNNREETIFGALSEQMIEPLRRSPRSQQEEADNNNNVTIAIRRLLYLDGSSSTPVSSLRMSSGSVADRTLQEMTPGILWQHFSKLHPMEKTEMKTKDGRSHRWLCKHCKVQQTAWRCRKCDKHICKDKKGGRLNTM